MRKMMTCCFLGLALALSVSTWHSYMNQAAAAEQTIRATAIGNGATQGAAKAAADNNAREISRGFYRTISSRITGREGSYTCTMVIEYKLR